MKASFRRQIKLTSSILVAILVLMTAASYTVPAFAEEDQRVVRVGYTDIDRFISIDKDGNATGYGADFMEEICKYTGWKCEYVKGTWQECLDRMESGDVDILFPAEKSAERQEQFLFSDYECCIDYVALLTRNDNDKIYYNDFGNYDGITVGMIDGNFLNEAFKEQAEEKGFSYNAKYYDNKTQTEEALASGEVDAIVNGNLSVPQDKKTVAKFGYYPAYFMVRSDLPDVLDELNSAMYNINLETPYFVSELIQKYYKNSLKDARGLTRQEVKFAHNCGTIKVVADPDNYPLEWYDAKEKKYRGVDIDILNMVSENTGLKFEIIKTDSLRQSWEMMRDGEADMIIGVFGNDAIESKYNIKMSDSYMNEMSCAVTQSGNTVYPAENLKVAVKESFIGTTKYIESNYPNWTIIKADTEEKCIDMVKNGLADITFVNSMKVYSDINHVTAQGVELFPAVTISVPLHFGISNERPDVMISLLNKGLGMVDQSKIDDLKIYNLAQSREFSIGRFIREHLMLSMTVIIILVGAAAFIIVMLQKNRAKSAREKLLVENNRMLEEANNAKSEFLQRMSHDMRTPMNGIIGLTSIDLENGSLPDDVKDDLRKVKETGMYMLSLVNDALDMSKIDNMKMALKEAPIDMQNMIENVVRQSEPIAQKKGVNFSIINHSDENHWFLGDRLRITQIFMNLISNAVKFTDVGGEVELIISCVENDRNKIAGDITVKDTGIGMSEDFLERIFDPFEQEDNGVIDAVEGTGLGMSIVKNLVDMMGGTIDIKSEKGKGTEVSVYLEFDEAEPQAAAEELPLDMTKLKDKVILVCDDHPLNREIAAKLLNAAGCLTETATDGREAVDMFSASEVGHFDAVLMDIRMPVMNGLEAAREIRATGREDSRSVPIVAMTANAFDEDIKASMEAGMNDHLSKPVNKELLYRALIRFMK